MNIDPTLTALKDLNFVRRVATVGSYAAGKKEPKDIDVLIHLTLTDAEMQTSKTRPIKQAIIRILKKADYTNWDLFLLTTDKVEWRLRPWEDEKGKITWDWE